MTFKSRCFSVTVHWNHIDGKYNDWMQDVGRLYDTGIIDYAVVSFEESSSGLMHFQGFIVWNETAEKPTNYLSGHWEKARSLSGARDYCAAHGIHVDKKGVHSRIEFGDWVDPAWNQNLRARKCYEFSRLILKGASYTTLASIDPAGCLYIGETQIRSLLNVNFVDRRNISYSPYYYIGRNDLEKSFDFYVDEPETGEEE